MYEDDSPALANGSNLQSASQPAASSSQTYGNGDSLHEDHLGPASISELDERLAELSDYELAELSAKVVAAKCIREQQAHLRAFSIVFSDAVNGNFAQAHPELLQSFATLVSSMQVEISEQALDSSSSALGTITISLPGLPDGVNVTRSKDTFLVNDGQTLLERNEVRVKMGGLDVYSGYWLAADSPANGIEDALQEEGIDTLRRVMEAAGINFYNENGDVYEDALEYPFLSAVLAPFGPEAMQPFEQHLRRLHSECGQEHGGCWFKMSAPSKSSRALQGVSEAGGHLSTAADMRSVPRSQLTAAEEAELEISKLDL